MIRENGYYWIKIQHHENWEIAEYMNGIWYVIGFEDAYKDYHLEHIDENRIVREE